MAEAASAATTFSHQHQPVNAPPRPSSLAMASGGSLPIRPHYHISTKLKVEDASLMTHHHHHHHHDDDSSASDAMACSPPRQAHSPPPHKRTSPLQMRLVIGGESQNLHHETLYTHVSHPQQHQHHAPTTTVRHDAYEAVERMEGVEHHGPKGPLVVMDGANIAYAYADAISGFAGRGTTEPDARGIKVAADYFLSMNVRVLVVIPAPWFRAKPRAGDEAQGTNWILTCFELFCVLHCLPLFKQETL